MRDIQTEVGAQETSEEVKVNSNIPSKSNNKGRSLCTSLFP